LLEKYDKLQALTVIISYSDNLPVRILVKAISTFVESSAEVSMKEIAFFSAYSIKTVEHNQYSKASEMYSTLPITATTLGKIFNFNFT
jgi:hypothetical protein